MSRFLAQEEEGAALAYIIQKMFLKLMTLASKALQPSWVATVRLRARRRGVNMVLDYGLRSSTIRIHRVPSPP
jgi:hypothetical protein